MRYHVERRNVMEKVHKHMKNSEMDFDHSKQNIAYLELKVLFTTIEDAENFMRWLSCSAGTKMKRIHNCQHIFT